MLFDMTKRVSYLDVGILTYPQSMTIVTLTHSLGPLSRVANA
jgi:hypothetical protein